jgi:hypothetical protein
VAGTKKRPNKSAEYLACPGAGAPATLMVGGGAVAVRRCDCDCSDSDADDNRGANGYAADEWLVHHAHWCDWRWGWLNWSGLCEGLCRNQAQDCCGSEKFFHL